MIRASAIAVLLALVHPVTPARASAAPCQPPVASQSEARTPWPQELLDPQRVWPFATGAGVTVAVLDTGVDARHPQLAGRVAKTGTSFVEERLADQDCDGHGTAVASIIAAVSVPGAGLRGLAPDAAILPITVTERRQQPDGSITGAAAGGTGFANAIDHAIANGARVINLSLVFAKDLPEVKSAIRKAIEHDIVVVAAVGNSADSGNPTPYPAAYPGVIGVGAINRDGQHWTHSGHGEFVDLVAPGVEVTIARPGGGHFTYGVDQGGTSFAAPFVAATAALVRQAFPKLRASEVAARLLATASPSPGGEWSPRYGYGIVDPYRALTMPFAKNPAPGRSEDRPLAAPVSPAGQGTYLAGVRAGLGGLGACALIATLLLLARKGRRRRWRASRTEQPPAPRPDGGAPLHLLDGIGL